MSADVVEKTVYVVTCNECSHRENHSVRLEAVKAAIDHENNHANSLVVASRIAGKVFDVDAPGAPWFGVIYNAAEHARKAGYPYLTWNGNVYTSVEPDLRNPVCDAKDLRAALDGEGTKP